MFSRMIPVAAAAAVLPLLGSQLTAQNSKVVPTWTATTEGGYQSYYPFLYDISRSQQVWNAPAVATGVGVINSVNFRRDGQSKSVFQQIAYTSVQIDIGHTSVSPKTMSTTFASNITSTMTTLLSGALTVPSKNPPTNGVAPFDIKFPAKTPYIYTPSKGNLLMDFTMGSGNANQKREWYLDAVQNTNGGGTINSFGTFGKFSGNDTPMFEGDASVLTPGGALDMKMSGFSQAWTSRLFFGVSNVTWNGLTLPWDMAPMGAPGNTLYTGVNVVLPFALQQGSTWEANVKIPLPNDNQIIGVRVFAQTYYADAKANAAGLVASNGLEIVPGSSDPITQTLGTSSTTQPTGSFLDSRGPSGAVVEFVGSIQ